MPEMNDNSNDIFRSIERNEKGQFNSRAKQVDLLKAKVLELNDALAKQVVQMKKAMGLQSKRPTVDKKVTQGMKAQLKALKDQSKTARQAHKEQMKMLKGQTAAAQKALKAYVKMQQQQARSFAKMQKQALKMKTAGPGRRGSGGGFSMGFGLPAFLSVAAITASTKALIGYTNQLARARDMAQALGGAFRDVNQYLPSKRDAELWAEFAGQAFSNRFASSIEIEGLKNLRDVLGKALGPDAGRALTLKLTESLKGSQAELQEFLAIASQDVPQALAAFQSADVENFSTALAASRQKLDELSQTAYTFETAWQEIKDTFEGFVTAFVEQHGKNLRTTIVNVAQGVIDLINAGRQLAADMKPVFDFLIAGFKQVDKVVDFWSDPLRGGKRAGMAQDLIEQMKNENAVAQVAIMRAKKYKEQGDIKRYQEQEKIARAASARSSDLYERALELLNGPQVKPLELKLADSFEKAKLDLTEVVDKSKEERKELEGMATSAEKAALKIAKINETLEVRDLMVAVGKSRLAAAESSPLLFSEAFTRRMQLVGLLDAKRKELEAKLHAIMAQDKILREDRMKALKIEAEINNLIAERNQLLKQQQKGYLDAILAQAFAAGKFEKIIMAQDRNVAMALEKRIALPSPFLGRVGEDALKKDVHPFRWTGDAAIDQAGMEKWTDELTEWMDTKPTKGDREIIARIDETNHLLQQRNVVPPIPAEALGIQAGITLGGGKGGKVTGKTEDSYSVIRDPIMREHHRAVIKMQDDYFRSRGDLYGFKPTDSQPSKTGKRPRKSASGNSNDAAKLIRDAVGQGTEMLRTLARAADALEKKPEGVSNPRSNPANHSLN